MNLGNGHSQLAQFDQAIACYRKAIELKPGYGPCYNNLGLALSLKNAYDEAIAAFEEAIRLRPDLATEAYAELSMILSNCPDARLRNAHRAAELANKAIEIEPNISNHWTALGIARFRQGQWQEAQAAFDRSLQLGTNSMGATLRWAYATDWFFLAMSNWQLSQPDEARKCYDRALKELAKERTWQTDFQQLPRIRAEAEQLLKITDEKTTTNPTVEVK
jgi:tetratricopeptide (TPR) repeat protein